MKNAVQKEMEAMKNEIRRDLKKLEERISEIERKQQENDCKCDAMQVKQNDLETQQKTYAEATSLSKRKLVIKNLTETEGESTKDRVKMLLTEGLGLKDNEIDIEEASRKGDPKVQRKYPRVIVVTVKNSDMASAIMKKKAGLKKKPQFDKVYIDVDKPQQQRQYENNMRTIVNSVAKDKLSVVGGKVVPKQQVGS